MIWALDELFRRGAAASGPQYLPAVRDLVSRHQADLQANPQLNEYMGRERASYLIGDAGMLMLQWKLEPTPELVERIHALLREKLGDARGLLWGAAGSMVAAVLLHERTGDSRWSSVFAEHFAALWDRWTWADELGCWVWVDELYGVKGTRLGALHGFVANAYAIARGSHLLPAARRDEALARIAQTLQRTALTGSDGANWPHDVGVSTRTEPMPLLVQFCSGGPGVVACMANRLPALDALWLQAGELTWRAGPTTKFPVLLSRCRRCGICAAQVVRAHRRRHLAHACACVCDARRRRRAARGGTVRPTKILVVDRRSRPRALSERLPARRRTIADAGRLLTT